MKKTTERTELVETHNLVLCLNRLAGPPYDSERWARALYHALRMAHVTSFEQLAKIREALKLP